MGLSSPALKAEVENTFRIRELAELGAVTSLLSELALTYTILLFHGGMGAGKTTLIKALCSRLGVTDDMGSPTFSIVNEYESDRGPVYHFDLYRIEREEELFDLGAEEYLHSGYLCLVEWPEMAPGLFADRHVSIRIELEDDMRVITVIAPE